MAFNENYQGNVPPEFLLDPKMMAEYINMMTANIEFLENEIGKMDETKQKTQNKLDEIINKREILSNFLEFTEAKGFGYAKGQAEEYIKEMQEAKKNRVHDTTCMNEYYFQGILMHCYKLTGHPGHCGVKIV